MNSNVAPTLIGRSTCHIKRNMARVSSVRDRGLTYLVSKPGADVALLNRHVSTELFFFLNFETATLWHFGL
jgi:hypothetical protein